MQFKYRFSTPALHGRWFTSAHMARADAIRAGQAYRDQSGTLVWRGSAGLEARPAPGEEVRAPGTSSPSVAR